MRPTMETKDKIIRVRISSDTLSELERHCEKKGISLSELIRDIIWRYLNEWVRN